MVHKLLNLLPHALLLALLVVLGDGLAPSPVYASANIRPILTLNLKQGPLGVTLTLNGENFTPGQAGLSYVDSQSTPGTFTPPSDTSVQVQTDGTFVTSNLILPSSGPIGPWKIVVTDSAGKTWSVTYRVLAPPGQDTAGAPGLIVNPTTGMSGDQIAFTGTNWLPAGTSVNLVLLIGTSPTSLLTTPPVSDQNGQIAGTFQLPSGLNQPQVTVSAADVDTGDLRAQTPIQITGLTPTPTVSPTPSPSPTPTSIPTATPTVVPTAVPTATPSPAISAPGGTDTSGGSSLDGAVLEPVLLLVSGILGVAALLLVLFLIPWGERRRNLPRGRP